MGFGFMGVYFRLHPKSSALLFTMCVKILEILFGGLGKGENGSVCLESVLMGYLQQVNIHAVALFVPNWVDNLALFLGRMRRSPFRGSACL